MTTLPTVGEALAVREVVFDSRGMLDGADLDTVGGRIRCGPVDREPGTDVARYLSAISATSYPTHEMLKGATFTTMRHLKSVGAE